MSEISPLFPRQPVPELEVGTLDGGTWRMSERKPQNFTMIVVYRGLHCPICRNYLGELQRHLPDFEKKGVEVLSVSSDDEERARQSRSEWQLDRLTLGYGLDFATARRWGLYLSHGRGKTSTGVEEPATFVEPGLFMIRPDHTLYFASVQTMPFARPHFADVAKAVDFVLAKDYPARGEVIDLPAAAE